MNIILKQCIGVDISKDSLECCIGSIDQDSNITFTKSKSFYNNEKGFNQLLTWFETSRKSDDYVFVMEATGVYYENLAYWLNNRNERLCVLLPIKTKHYAKSLNIKTKTDSKDAQVLSRFGLERKVEEWKMPSKMMREIKFLTRELREVKEKIVVVKNQLHAKQHSHECLLTVEKRLRKQITLLETQVLEIEAEIRDIVMSDSEFYKKFKVLLTIPGVSFITIIIILAETNAFALIKNAKQLVSYSGLDVQHNQSGAKSGKSKISKKGNSFIRGALYMPSLSASKHNPHLKIFYQRLNETKPAKKVALTAVSRKLLILIYTLWKNQTEFNSNYSEEKSRQVKKPAYAG